MEKKIRVNILFSEAYRERWWPVLSSRHILHCLDVDVLDNAEESCDICIVQSDLLEGLIERRHPALAGTLIIHERADQETVCDHNRALLKQDNVRAWMKECGIRENALQNAPHVHGYYHLTLMPSVAGDPVPLPPVVPVTEKDLEKVVSFVSVANFARFETYRKIDEARLADKKIDVFYFGTTSYGTSAIGQHRLDASRELGKVPGRKVLIATGYVLEEVDIHRFMAGSKMLLSPYGHCMSSYKDWMALFTETVVIKPKGAHLQTNLLPDIFTIPGWHVQCEPDFSDLQDVIEEVLGNYAVWKKSAHEARLAALESCTEQRVAIAFNALMRTVLAGGRAIDWPKYPEPKHIPINKIPLTAFYDNVSKRAARSVSAPIWATSDNVLTSWFATRAKLLAATGLEAPEGHVVVRLEDDNTAQNTHDIRRLSAKHSAQQRVRFTFLAKADSRDSIIVWIFGEDQRSRAALGFNLRNSSLGLCEFFGQWGQPIGGVLDIHDGWKMCWMETSTDNGSSVGVLLGLAANPHSVGYDGDGKSGLYLAALRMDMV